MSNKKINILIILIILISFSGIILSLFLSFIHLNGLIGKACAGPNAGCLQVLTSEYSEVLGIPLAFFGFIFYYTVFLLHLNMLFIKKYFYFIVSLILSVIGVFTSGILFIIQALIIEKFCKFCLLSGLETLLIFIFSVIIFLRKKRELKIKPEKAAPAADGQNIRNKKLVLWQTLTLTALLVSIVGAFLYLEQNYDNQILLSLIKNLPRYEVNEKIGYTYGDKEALYTVVEFFDLECAFCYKFEQDVFPIIEKKYIDTKEIKWIFIDYPLKSHKNSTEASIFLNLYPERFMDLKKQLYRTKEEWGVVDNPWEFFRAIAKKINLDESRITRANINIAKKIIENNIKAAKDLKIKATPGFIINGIVMQGYYSLNQFEKILKINSISDIAHEKSNK